MTGVPPRLHPRDSGDAWVEGPDGRRFWGRYGAAGLLVHDEQAGVLLQHRAEWSHFGGTWGLPGGARHAGESAVDGAIREAGEEAGVPADALEIAFTSTLDLGYWSYVTVVMRAARSFEPAIGDAESLELRWVPVDEVETLPLHPGFGSAWPGLRSRLGERIRVVVDAANVVGSRPDGWWKDRLGANEALLARLGELARRGIASAEFSRAEESGTSGEFAPSSTAAASAPAGPIGRSWPSITVIVEGKAREAEAPAASTTRVPDAPDSGLVAGLLSVVPAEGSGDDTIVATVADMLAAPDAADAPASTVVVTADRELAARVGALGAEVRGPGWLLALLDDLAAA